MITLTLTEAEAARVYYVMQAEASEYSRKIYAEKREGALSAASGRAQMLLEAGRDECLAIARKVDAVN